MRRFFNDAHRHGGKTGCAYDRKSRFQLNKLLHNDLAKLEQIVAQSNAARPDFICILGDLGIRGVVDGIFVPPEPVAQELANLHAPLGAVSVLGNHDYWVDEAQVTRALQNNSIIVLSDSAMTVNTLSGPIWTVGVSDFWTGKHDVISAMQFVSDDNPVIAITHNPEIFPIFNTNPS